MHNDIDILLFCFVLFCFCGRYTTACLDCRVPDCCVGRQGFRPQTRLMVLKGLMRMTCLSRNRTINCMHHLLHPLCTGSQGTWRILARFAKWRNASPIVVAWPWFRKFEKLEEPAKFPLKKLWTARCRLAKVLF